MSNEKVITNNVVELYGKIISVPEFSHELYGEKFYNVMISVKRLSGSEDEIMCQISERLIDIDILKEDVYLHIGGQFRSFNKVIDDTHRKLILSVFCRSIEILDNIDDITNTNTIKLQGFICKDPTYRKTPLGREITDLLVAVNRPYGKSDYIPCITWGRNAIFASKLEVSSNIEIIGRIQSREYTKVDNEGNSSKNIAYEVSVNKILPVME